MAKKIGRIAFRVEGDYWNAYYALPDSMDRSLLLGSIRLSVAKGNPNAKRQFMDLMRVVVGDVFKAHLGTKPTWNDPVPAPEHERTKE